MSGRISHIAVDPTNKQTWYVGVASGGLWKTTNAGTSFTPIFEKESSYSIGAVVIDPNRPTTIWVGTGEGNNQRSVGYGDGIYRSDDAGRTWRNMGLKTSEHVSRIAIDPRDSNVVFAAAYGPLWNVIAAAVVRLGFAGAADGLLAHKFLALAVYAACLLVLVWGTRNHMLIE